MAPGDTRRRILVIENELELATRLQSWMGEGDEILTAENLSQALELHDERVSITFVDRTAWDCDIDDLGDIARNSHDTSTFVSVSTRDHTPPLDTFDNQLQDTGGEAEDSLERSVKRLVYEADIRNWIDHLERKIALEQRLAADELEGSGEYRELLTDIELLRERANLSRDAIPGERFDAVFRESDRPSRGWPVERSRRYSPRTTDHPNSRS